MNAALAAALSEHAVQYSGSNVPNEVLRLFPNWSDELPRTCQRGASDLRVACKGLEEAEMAASQAGRAADMAGYAFARGALQGAISIHDNFSEQSRLQAAPVPSGFQQGVSGGEMERLVRRLQAEAPPAVHSTFPNFCTELVGASQRPVLELRAAAARLQAAHADVATRLFNEPAEPFPPLGGASYGSSSLVLEAQALEFCVRAMTALVQSKSTVAVADAVAEAVSSGHRYVPQHLQPRGAARRGHGRSPLARHSVTARELASITSTRDADLGMPGGAFNFRTLAPQQADPFNPCCERDDNRDERGMGDAPPPLAPPLGDERDGQQPWAAVRASSPERASPERDHPLVPETLLSPNDELSIDEKMCGLPLKMEDTQWMDDMDEIELAPLRKPPTPLYTGEVDLSETGAMHAPDAWDSMGDTMDSAGTGVAF